MPSPTPHLPLPSTCSREELNENSLKLLTFTLPQSPGDPQRDRNWVLTFFWNECIFWVARFTVVGWVHSFSHNQALREALLQILQIQHQQDGKTFLYFMQSNLQFLPSAKNGKVLRWCVIMCLSAAVKTGWFLVLITLRTKFAINSQRWKFSAFFHQPLNLWNLIHSQKKKSNNLVHTGYIPLCAFPHPWWSMLNILLVLRL